MSETSTIASSRSSESRRQAIDLSSVTHPLGQYGTIRLTGASADESSSSTKPSAADHRRLSPLHAQYTHGQTVAAANRGYLRQGREKLIPPEDGRASEGGFRKEIVELKESFEIGREPHERYANHWPKEKEGEGGLVGFGDDMMKFFGTCKDLHVQVMRAIAMGLGLDESHFDAYVDVGDNTLRLLHYPQVDADVFKANAGQVRAGEHCDYGSITLLFQDDRGGLQVKSPSGKFVDAIPIPDTVVINAGDLLARWSNDTIKSTIHRVVEPPHDASVQVFPPRYSVAYFCNPNFDRLIEAMPGTYNAEVEKKYEGITSGDYLVQRLAATF
ncbi:hypothetical protein NQ176_g7782 [Zarea fungicola]|uniref:Uncharacterized protein n=1 Tax=Zarea fungicola TaxID=93591 RepID=A0ACC1MW64_9HYPO|nr:hypothetical protein NQ176_g7782 [Lecanicillium fungicola]